MTASAPRPHLFDLTPRELTSFCTEHGMTSFAAGQILDWVYRKGVVDPAEMTNLPRRDRERLADELVIHRASVVVEQLATDGTRKLLLQWDDWEAGSLPVIGRDPSREVECVMIPTAHRRTACVSSQIGCPVGCTFCASGLGGLDANLAAGQIVEQVHRLSWLPDAEPITNVVFMGMGEPLANYAAVTRAIRTINASWGLGIGARRITVSTVGLPAAIRRFATFEIPVTLALSLHAPDDDLRREIIPWAEYAPIDELLDACDAYFQQSGREITFEYILLGDFNDRPQHARRLARLAKRLRANVNLIRYNEVEGLPFTRPATDNVRRFQSVLRKAGVNTHIRASRGRDIAAACGQLRAGESADER